MDISLQGYKDELSTGDETDRVYAVEDLGSLGTADAARLLTRHVKAEKSPQVKEAVFHALQVIQDPAVLDCAVELFSDDDPFIRNRAVELLRGRRQTEALGRLAVTLQSPDADIRKLSVDALWGCEVKSASELYAIALRDRDLNVVITAVEAVGRGRRCELIDDVNALFLFAEQPMLIGACLETMATHGNAKSLDAVQTKFGAGGPPALFVPSYLRLHGRAATDRDTAFVVPYLHRPEPGVCAAALDCLLCICNRLAPITAGEDLRRALHLLRTEGAPALRAQAERVWSLLTEGCS